MSSGPTRWRLVLVPLGLFLGVSALAFGLAKLHLARPGTPRAAANSKIVLGDSYRGETIFGQTCAACHGQEGIGGGGGPKLVGDKITLSLVKLRIDFGKGVMPAGLLEGQQERDVLAFVAGIIAQPGAK